MELEYETFYLITCMDEIGRIESTYNPGWMCYQVELILSNKLGRRATQSRSGSWKGSQKSFPESVQVDVRLGMFTQ